MAAGGPGSGNGRGSVGHLDYGTFFELATDGMLLATAAGTVLDANHEACRLLGCARDELLGSGDVFDGGWGPVEEAVRSERRFAGRLRIRRRDGTAFAADVSVLSLDPRGCGGVVCVVFGDATERGRLEEASRFHSLLVNSALDMIGVLETDSTVRYVSPSIERVLGYRPGEVIGAKILDYLHPEDQEEVRARFADVLEGTGFDPLLKVRYRHKDGSWRWLEGLATNLLDDPSVGGIAFVSRDVTERKKAEEELRFLSTVSENSLDALVVVDAERNVRYFGPRGPGRTLLGYPIEDRLNLHVSTSRHPEDAEKAVAW